MGDENNHQTPPKNVDIKSYKERVDEALDATPHMTEEEFYFQMSRSMGTPIKYMKYSSVKELNDTIMQAVENDDAFEAHLFSKYPTLFPTDADGNLLPQSQRCWNDCPDGWRNIVESLFACIDDYVKNCKHTQINPKRKLQPYIHKVYWKYMRDPIYRKFDPYGDYKKRSAEQKLTLTDEEREKIYKTFAARVRRFMGVVERKFLDRHNLYISVSPPPVTIEQYKEKFGTLRVYFDGGDDVVKGMVRYAEYLSSITCQDTGKPGELCRRGGWYTTLSKAQAKKQGYKPVTDL